jgi:hypothetical protein
MTKHRSGSDASAPTRDDLVSFTAFAERFAEPGFVVGAWTLPKERDDGAMVVGWWSSSEVVNDWNQALYDCNIIDADSAYLSDANVAFVNRSIADPSILATIGLAKLRCALTFLARAERHTEGGWYEQAFNSGMAQAATGRLLELADGRRSPGTRASHE